MFDFFNKLFNRQPETVITAPDPTVTGVRLYTREHGPIAYEARVFTSSASSGALRDDLPQQLLSSGLDWYWESGRYSDEYPAVNPALPKRRSLTRLSAGNISSLLDDLKEHTGGCPRWFNIFGLESGANDDILQLNGRRVILENFSSYEKGPLAMVVYQEGEVDWEVVFVGHNPPEQVKSLLESWGINEANVVRVFQDRETHGIFEISLDLPQRKA